MIGLLKGEVFYKNVDNIIILVNGVGYRVEATQNLLGLELNKEVVIYIYTQVREDCIKLFGFLNEKELKLFEKLLSVSGIGPKNAASIISSISIEDIYSAIISENSSVFKKVSGVGTKNAERIVVELKSKIKKEFSNINPEDLKGTREVSSVEKEFQLAMTSLGYTLDEIKELEGSVDFTQGLSLAVKEALKLLNA